MKLNTNQFGRTDSRISELGLSTSNFSRHANHEESFAILDAFREAGGNFIQSSGICPGIDLGDGFLGLPEELLGRWLKRRPLERTHIVIATRIALTRPVVGGLGGFTRLIRQCAEDSVRRMDCGFLDFLVVEWTDALAPMEESMTALGSVIDSGEVRHIVPANFPRTGVLEAFAATRPYGRGIAGLQIDHSLATSLAFENGIVDLSDHYGLGIVARSPLGGGHLASRRLTSGLGALRYRGPLDRQAAIAAESVWPVLSAIAKARHCSPAQVALSWVLAHPQITSVLISVSSVAQFRELFTATRLRLASEDIARLGTTRAHPRGLERTH